MRWLLKQLAGQSAGNFQSSSGFKYKYLNRNPINADVLMTELAHEELRLHATGPWVKLTFHTHAWCGASEFVVNGQKWREDLYSDEHGFREVVVTSPNGRSLDIQIRTGAEPNKSAKANQLWLAAVEFAEPQNWVPASQPITPTCTLTRGTHGTFLTLTTDTIVGASIVNSGTWAPNDVALFESLISEGMTVLDVGANIGHHTVVYGKLVGPNGRVVSFEPQTTIFRVLSANTVMNGGMNTDLIQACVGEAEGFVHLYPVDYNSQANFGALGVDPNPDTRPARGEKCRVVRLDDALLELSRPIERVDFIKIDVQSFELYVLRGALDTLSKYKPTLFLEISPYWMSKKYDYKEIYHFLWALGYKIDHLSDPEVQPGTVKEWSGRQGEEWDILARHPDSSHANLAISN